MTYGTQTSLLTYIINYWCNLHISNANFQNLWNAVRDFITFFSFARLCMKFKTFFVFIKLSFLKTILTSYNVSIIRLLHILHKTLSRPSFTSACVLKKVYLDYPAQKFCLEHFWRYSNRSCRVTVVV